MKIINKLLEMIDQKLYRSIAEKNMIEIKKEIDSIVSRLAFLYIMDRGEELSGELDKYQKWIDGAAGSFDTEGENIAYQEGILAGTVWAVRHMQENDRQLKNYEISHLDTKYQDKIIELLIDTEYMQHTQLAHKLEISSSQLSNIMHRMEGAGQNIISASKVGKFKYYCLTDMGRRFYKSQYKGSFREQILELLQCVLDRGKLGKHRAVKGFADRYFTDDIEVKRKALEVEKCFDFPERRGRILQISNVCQTAGIAFKPPVISVSSCVEDTVHPAKPYDCMKAALYKESREEFNQAEFDGERMEEIYG